MNIVREGLYNFHKTGDVKSGLNIGILNRKEFDSDEDIANWFISIFPAILGTDDIPHDILEKYRNSSNVEITDKYVDPIVKKCKESNIGIGLRDPIEWYDILISKLLNMGFIPMAKG